MFRKMQRYWKTSCFTGVLFCLASMHSACVTGSVGHEVVHQKEAVPKQQREIARSNPGSVREPAPPRMVKISFYYDANINGKRDIKEIALTNLKFTIPACCRSNDKGSFFSPERTELMIRMQGRVPAGLGRGAGKTLTVVTLDEPRSVRLLPRCILPVGERDMEIGLADGFLTSPLAPETIARDGYSAALRDPEKWKKRCQDLYPPGWRYHPNYYYYGYRIPEGGLEGKPHHALDIGAAAGTPVYAAAPGHIVKPLYDWSLGITGQYGTVYYSHIKPVVAVGTLVARSTLIGYVAENQGEHIHLELRPWPAAILRAFPGMSAGDLLRSPLRGEPVLLPPFIKTE